VQLSLEALRRGDVRALARAITFAENEPAAGERLVETLGPFTTPALVVGITGAPGVGKSTLIKSLIEQALNAGRRVGVLAVDPSSPLSGGALLGDRCRMVLPDVEPHRLFIRSLSSRGRHGGTSRGLGVSIRLLRHAGYDVVLAESTGAGQCEFDLARVVDLLCVLLAEGAGDEMQAMKSGLMEVADVFVINKCLRPGTENLRRDLESCLAHSSRFERFGLLPPPVLLTDAVAGQGVAALWERLSGLAADPAHQAAGARKRGHFLRQAVVASVLEELKDRLLQRLHERPPLSEEASEIESRVRTLLLGVCREALAAR